MEYIEVQYNQKLKDLEDLLSDVKQPGEFYVAGTLEIPMPRVEVKGIGTLSFPIPRPQIEALVRHATQAPYGRGEETIVDTSVRNVWQIDPGGVEISGKSWAANFALVLSKVIIGLGCENAAVSAELYKMLVYDRGGFFLPHRDTEKSAGMFGTLVVTLPTIHQGGSLRLRHRDREITIETDAAEPSEISFAAFYADCEHEVLPVREGSRVCLVYNLIQARAKGGQRIPKAPEYGSNIAKAADILDAFWSSRGAPSKIAWLLEHQYSPAGLSFSSLKGADSAKSRVLAQAAGQARCVAHLGIVHIGESGAAEEDGDFNRAPRSRYEDSDYEDEEGNEDDGEDEFDDASFTAVTVDETWRHVDEWRDTSDRVVEFGRIPLAAGELLPAGALDEEPPDEQRLTEASGNEGASYERSYHRAALVIWPGDRTIDVLLEGGVPSTLPHLRQLIANGERSRPEAIAAAQRIARAWPTDADLYSIDVAYPESSDRATMIASLVELNAKELLERFIRKIVTPSYDGSENEALCTSASVLGDAKASAVFSALVETHMRDKAAACVDLLLALSANPFSSYRKVAAAVVAGLDTVVAPKAEPDDPLLWRLRTPVGRQRRPNLAPPFLVRLFSALRVIQAPSLCTDAADKIASRPEVFPPVAMVVPAIQQISAEPDLVAPPVDLAMQRLWTSTAEFLLQRSEVPPQPPADWRLQVTISCTCDDCTELQTFARDAGERVHRFRVRKERRSHLHQAIDRHQLDMTHVTERVGSPQTLVCTKDRRTFQARMEDYRSEIAAMRTLLALAPKVAGADDLCRRMDAAAEASSD